MLVKPELVNMRELPADGVTLDHLAGKSSLELMDMDAEALPADDRYRLFQRRDNSWSHNGDWGMNAVNNANIFHRLLQKAKAVYEDDVFCDFGGNDGTVAEAWRSTTGNTVYSVDLDALKQGWGMKSYPQVTFVNAFLEDIPLDDKTVDWAFCSHTLEHVADLDKALSEITRITRQGLFVVVPLEAPASFWQSKPHMRGTHDPLDWVRTLRRPELRLIDWAKPMGSSPEMFLYYALPDWDLPHLNDMHDIWLA